MLVYQRVVHQGMISAMQNEVISAETTFLWSLRESSQGQILLGDIEDQSQRWSSDVICATDNQGYHSSLYPLGVRYSGTISYILPWIPRKSKLHDWKGTFDISSIHPMLGLVVHTNLGLSYSAYQYHSNINPSFSYQKKHHFNSPIPSGYVKIAIENDHL